MFHAFNNACLDPKIIWTCSYLISSQNFEGLHDLFSCVGVSSFPSHEIQEGLKGDVARVIGVNNRHDALEVCISLKSPNTLVIKKMQLIWMLLKYFPHIYKWYSTQVCYQILPDFELLIILTHTLSKISNMSLLSNTSEPLLWWSVCLFALPVCHL